MTLKAKGKRQKVKVFIDSTLFLLTFTFILALGLRLLVWRWHEQYPLGGDEQEYFNQALTLLREHRYAELNLMRPPLYTGFLAACIALLDSLIQRIRLVQALISALTIVPVFLLARAICAAAAQKMIYHQDAKAPRKTIFSSFLLPWRSDKAIPLLAALLCALDFTLAASATELLTETLFTFGLATFFWLLLRAARAPRFAAAGLAGLALGALMLLRSVALPLLPLGALWLLLQPTTDDRVRAYSTTPRRTDDLRVSVSLWFNRRWSIAVCFVLAAALVLAPWALRNYATYGAPILIDTTGAENLWLDNNPAAATPADPLGREAAKRALYALGDDRAARQQLATRSGLAAIAGHPGWFAQKAWGEAQKFFALQFFDDMRARRAIWLPPPEVWLSLALGDGLWLVLLLAGAAGLWLAPQGRRMKAEGRIPAVSSFILHPSSFKDPRWLFVPWVLYTLFTAMLFHTELRYRLPLYPVLLPYAALAIATWRPRISGWRMPGRARLGAALTCLALIGMTLLHRPYPAESLVLARKHWQLGRAERALAAGDAANASQAANAALALDPDSALARVALARAALAENDRPGALAQLEAAIGALRAQPYAHLLRGALLREAGDRAGAAAEFAYESSSRDDLQRWGWQAFDAFMTVPLSVTVGQADLGFIQGFWLPEDGARWTRAAAQIQLANPSDSGGASLLLELNAGRPAGAPPPSVRVLVNGQEVARLAPANSWASYTIELPAALVAPSRRVRVALRSDTFRPRDYDPASPDNRALGVLVRNVAVVP